MSESKLTEELLAWNEQQKLEVVERCPWSMPDLRLECLRLATTLIGDEVDRTTVLDLITDAGTLLYYVVHGSPPPDDDAPPWGDGGACDA
jgi:hypothetical protein